MSELIQSGQHPDADQLSAFVEQALPAHEREQTLVHLAICADCRAIVALALPLDEVPALQPEPARRPWLSGWNLAWPAVGLAALAALVFFIVHLHSPAPIKSGVTAPTEIATSRPPAPLPVQSAPSVSAPAPSPVDKPLPPNRPATASTARAGGAAPPSPGAGMLGQGVVNGRLENPRLLAPPQGQGAVVGGAINGANAAPLPAVATAPQSLPAIPPNAPQPNIVAAGNADSVAPLASRAKTPPIPYNQARAAAASPQAATAGAVGVDSGSNVIGVTNTINGYNVDPNTAPVRGLPSHLPALSTARNGQQVLAIDTQNELFYSDDDGKHWTSVPSQWRGRALRVALARPSAPAIAGAVSSFGAVGGPVAAAVRVAGTASLSGTITDATGAVISGASVTISDEANKVVRTVTSDRNGHYVADNLSPGSYQVAAMAPGFQKQQLAVGVVASQQNQANLTLTVDQASETVTVEAETSAVALAAPRAALKKAAPASVAKPPVAVFEITTDNGERWTSPDGKTWTKR